MEVYLIDQELLDFFPDTTQKHIWSKLLHVFEPDRPYMLRNVQRLKDKFREWDVYKVKTVQDQMKANSLRRVGTAQGEGCVKLNR